MFERALVVMTPLTARRLGAEREAITRAMRRAFPRSELVLVGDSRALVREVGSFDPDLIIAAGGDGTVNLALAAMRAHDALAVLPLGTANDLARFLGVARNPAYRGSFVLGATRTIDCLRVNGRRFCTTGGLGLPAEVANRVNVSRHADPHDCLTRLGSHLYSLIAAQLCASGPPRYQLELTFEAPDGRREHRVEIATHGLFVSNQASFAGGLELVADADNADGVFELCVLLARGRWQLLRLLGHLVQRQVRPGESEILRARRAVIRSDRQVRFFGDGEILAESREFIVEIDAAALHVWS